MISTCMLLILVGNLLADIHLISFLHLVRDILNRFLFVISKQPLRVEFPLLRSGSLGLVCSELGRFYHGTDCNPLDRVPGLR